MTHPIVLPPHIEIKLIDEAPRFRDGGAARERWLIQRAAQLGADQELQACCEWLRNNGLYETRIGHLRAARRPKSPSLKEQALEALEQVDRWGVQSVGHLTIHDDLIAGVDIIRRALESLSDSQD